MRYRHQESPAEIEARLSQASRKHVWPFALAVLATAIPGLIQIIGG